MYPESTQQIFNYQLSSDLDIMCRKSYLFYLKDMCKSSPNLLLLRPIHHHQPVIFLSLSVSGAFFRLFNFCYPLLLMVFSCQIYSSSRIIIFSRHAAVWNNIINVLIFEIYSLHIAVWCIVLLCNLFAVLAAT